MKVIARPSDSSFKIARHLKTSIKNKYASHRIQRKSKQLPRRSLENTTQMKTVFAIESLSERQSRYSQQISNISC